METKKASSYFLVGILLCVLGSICFSSKAIFVKMAYRDTPVDAVTLLALRMLFSLPFFIASATFASQKRNNVKFTGKQWLAVAFIGCLGYYISSLLDFIGMQYISAGIERLILFIYPTLVLLISSVFFRISIRPYQWVAILITYAGLVVAFWGEIQLDGHTADFYKGAFLIFLCAITYASYLVGSGRLIPLVGAAKFNSYAMSFAAAGVLMHFLIMNSNSLFNLSLTVYVYSFLMAILATVIPSYLISAGIDRIGAGNAAIVGSVGPVSTIIQAYFFLGEPIHLPQVAGTALILVGVLMIGRKSKSAV